MVFCPDCGMLEELLVLGNSNHNAEMRRRKVLCFSLICISLTNRCVFKVFCTPIKAFEVRTLGVH